MVVDLETATTRLYEEASLTDDLVDQDATMLLRWAEQQVAELVTKYGSDEAAFENAFSALRSLVKNMNRYVGQLDMSDEKQQAQRLENITRSASEIGFEMTPAFGAQSLAPSAKSNSDLIQAMLNSLQKTGTSQAATAQPSSTTTAASSRHTRRMTLQGAADTEDTDTTTLTAPEPQEIAEDRVVNVFTLPEQAGDDNEQSMDDNPDDKLHPDDSAWK
jgi:hypothetical protein